MATMGQSQAERAEVEAVLRSGIFHRAPKVASFFRYVCDRYFEGEADKVMLEQLRGLYNGPCDAKELVILQKLFEMVEQAVDRCRNAGNIVVQVALKHS